MSHPLVRAESRILLMQTDRADLPCGLLQQASANLLRIHLLEQLPEPSEDDVLLTLLSWARTLTPQQHEQLSGHGRATGAWIVLTDTAPDVGEQLHWHKLGVDHFFPEPKTAQEWTTLLDWLMNNRHTAAMFQQPKNDNEARYRFFLDNIEEGVVVCAKGIIVDASDRWLELFRCKREEAIGLPVLDHFTSPVAVPMAKQLIAERWDEPYESVMLRKDGTTFPAIVRGRDQMFNGRELRLTTILDISRQKKVEQTLQLAKANAERANHAKSEFLSRMSHELRTPLNAILGFSQILEMDEQMTEGQLDSVAEIFKAGHHLLGLINEVLDLAGIESGKITLSLETVDVSELLLNCRQFVQPLAASRQITLHSDVPEGTAVRADYQRLKQVLLNLLSNAIKYNHPAGEVRIAVESDDHRVRITIADTGAGIPSEHLNELFQPFNRLGADRTKVEGTGIGLVITRKLTEAMGGQIGVESTPDKGSSFWIDLPVAQLIPAPAAAPQQIRETRFAPLTAKQGQRSILYIDDNPVNLKLASQILDKLRQIHLVTIHAPQIGIDFALAHQPDLIMLDINLPGMDGYQVLQVLQSHLQLRHVPVIAVSANAMPRDIEKGMAAGFADYLTKPLDIGRFLASVDAHLPNTTEKHGNAAGT